MELTLAIILVTIQILAYTNIAQPLSAEMSDFKEFAANCTNKLELQAIKKDTPDYLKKKYQHEICEAYITGYLDVANHNCNFDFYPDDLHKLNTRKISIKQITKAWEIYYQQLPSGTEGTTIDHLWQALNPHWPCQQ